MRGIQDCLAHLSVSDVAASFREAVVDVLLTKALAETRIYRWKVAIGDIKIKPNIDRYPGGRTVRFTDGSEEEIDLVVYCTGYKMTFPFFDPEVFSAPDNRLPLYRRVASVELPICGARTTFGIASRRGFTAGSNSYTSRPAPAR